MNEMASSSKPIAEFMIDKLTSTHGVPSLQNFARKTMFKDLGFSVPDWDMAALEQNHKINMKYRRLVEEHNKLVLRITRRKSELKVARDEHRFLQEKLKDLEIAVEEEDWSYVKDSLHSLHLMQTDIVEQIQYFVNLAQVVFSIKKIQNSSFFQL